MSELSRMSPQGLQAVVYALEEQIDEKDAEIALLKARIAKLEPALEVFANPMAWDWRDSAYVPGTHILVWCKDRDYRDPAAFARKALDP